MKKIIILLTLMVCFISFSQSKNFIDQPYLETKARVDTLVSPDRIYLSIFLTEEDDKNKVSLETKEREMAKTLEHLNIDLKEQLKLDYLNSYNKRYFLRGQNVIKSKSYTLKLYDAITASQVLVSLEKQGIANVHLLKKTYSKLDSLKINLKAKAIKKARKQAQTMIHALGQNLGKAIYINDGYFQDNTYYSSHRNLAYSPTADMMNEEPIDIEFSKIKVEAEVSIRFAID